MQSLIDSRAQMRTMVRMFKCVFVVHIQEAVKSGASVTLVKAMTACVLPQIGMCFSLTNGDVFRLSSSAVDVVHSGQVPVVYLDNFRAVPFNGIDPHASYVRESPRESYVDLVSQMHAAGWQSKNDLPVSRAIQIITEG